MDDHRPDIRRCVRTARKTGQRCGNGRMLWPLQIDMPDPDCCVMHLTDAERAAYEADKPRRDQEYAALNRMADEWWTRLIDSDPACWSWPPFTDADVEAYRATFSEKAAAMIPEECWRGSAMVTWHQGRCAICGTTTRLVNDHDHSTGLERGRLCGSCNTLEGFGHGGVFGKYRERNPASICGVQVRYWNPFTREYAEPLKPYDPWRDNPMRTIGL